MRILNLLFLLFACAAAATAAEDIFVYPNGGQDPTQQQQDRYECHRWAVQQSGFDPSTATPPNSGPVAVARSRHDDGINPVTGAAGGAAMGAVGGAIAGDAGKGAAIGAGVGALAGVLHQLSAGTRERERAEEEARKQAAAQQQAADDYAYSRARYERALTACLEGRNYTVR